MNRVSYSLRVGKVRQKLIRDSINRVESSINRGYHLEAIVLLESLISDRLEAALSLISKESGKVSNLSPLLISHRKVSTISAPLLDQLDSWRVERNLALHQMVKLTTNLDTSLKTRLKFARNVALEGRELLKELQKEVNKIKRSAVSDFSK